MIFQDPYSALNPRMTARQTLAETLHVVRDVPRRDAGQQAEVHLGQAATGGGDGDAVVGAQGHFQPAVGIRRFGRLVAVEQSAGRGSLLGLLLLEQSLAQRCAFVLGSGQQIAVERGEGIA